MDEINYVVRNNDLAPEIEAGDMIVFFENMRYQILKGFGRSQLEYIRKSDKNIKE